MKKQSKLLIGIIAAVAVLAVVIFSIVMAVSGSGKDTYDSHMELAQRYLDELQYEQAIAEYEAAIEIEPHNPEAYLGLAEVYLAMGDMEKALDVLTEGYEQTQSERIAEKQEELTQAIRNLSAENSTGEESPPEPTPEPIPEPTPELIDGTFAKEMNLQFSDSQDISLPSFAGVSEGSGEYSTETEHFRVEDRPAKYSFQSFAKSEPDAEGNVVYTIIWRVDYTIAIDVLDFPWDALGPHISFANWGIFDYYTGTYLTPEENSSADLDIIWEDNTYHINSNYSVEVILDKQSENSSVYEYMEFVGTLEYCYEITVPSDYDGLVLYIGEGWSQEDYETGKENPEFGTILDFEDSSKGTYIRVEDCIK